MCTPNRADSAWPILYSFRRCPYAMRARLAIAVSEQHCELREVVLRDKPPELLIASTKGTVPVLVQPTGAVIDESLDIMIWALQRCDPHRWLEPQQGTLVEMLALIAHFDGVFKFHLDRYKYPNRYPGVDAHLQRAEAAKELFVLNDRLALTDHLYGTSAALADMAIAPFIRQFAATDTVWFDAQPWPHLQQWLQRFNGSGLFRAVMQSCPVWKAGAPGVCFPAMTVAAALI